MTSLINNGGSAFSDQLLHDLFIFPGKFLTEAINLAGDGEIRSVRVESAVLVDIAIRVGGAGPWRVHHCRLRSDDTALIVDADGCLIHANLLGGDNNGALIVNGDDNMIVGNFATTGLFINGDDNSIVDNTSRMFNGPDNVIVIAGNRNYVGGNKYINTSGGTPSAVGLEILSGATGTIVGVNDFS